MTDSETWPYFDLHLDADIPLADLLEREYSRMRTHFGPGTDVSRFAQGQALRMLRQLIEFTRPK